MTGPLSDTSPLRKDTRDDVGWAMRKRAEFVGGEVWAPFSAGAAGLRASPYNGDGAAESGPVAGGDAVLQELIGRKVVIDLRSEYVCLGTLTRTDDHFLELKNADLHDLRDTETTRETYVAE